MAVQVPAKRYYTIDKPYGPRIHELPAASPDHRAQQQSFVKAYPYQRVEVTPPQNLPTPPSSDSPNAKRRRLNSTTIHPPAHEAYPETMYSFTHSPVHNIPYTRPEALQQMYASQMPVQPTQRTQATNPVIISPPQAVYPHPPQPQLVHPPKPIVSQTVARVGSTQSQGSSLEAVIMSIPVLDKIKVLSQISRPLPAPGIISTKSGSRGAIIAIEGTDATSVDSMTGFLAAQLEKEGKFAVKIFDGPDLYSGSGITSRGGAMTAETYLKTLSEWHKINQKMVEYITTGPGCELGKAVSVTSGSRSSPIPIDDNDQDHQMSAVDGPKTPDKIVQIDERSETSSEIPESSHVAEDTITVVHSVQPPPLTFPRPLNSTRIPPLPSTPPLAKCPIPPPPLTFPRPLNSTRTPPPPSTPPPAKSPISLPPPANNSSQLSNAQAATATASTEQHPRESQPVRPSSNAIPIALIPRFQLTTVDTASILMPISDGLSPESHWEWFAALWRGTVGPDITIVIKGLDNEPSVGEVARTKLGPGDAVASLNDARDKNSNAGVRSGQHSGVKIRLNDYRTLVVRTGLVSSSLSSITGTDTDGKTADVISDARLDPAQQVKEWENWERAKRRIGFEVEEYLRR